MATFGFVLSYPRALTEMWGLEPKLPVTQLHRHYGQTMIDLQFFGWLFQNENEGSKGFSRPANCPTGNSGKYHSPTKRMMYFTESDAASCENPVELNDEFEAQHNRTEYEAKMSRLLRHAYNRLMAEDPEGKRN